MPALFDAWKRLFDRPAAPNASRAEEIRAWQKTLLEEHEELRDELEVLLRTYVRTLDRFAERANQLTEEQFLQEQEAIESIRKILQNAIRRLEVSCKDHRELLDEWHEWLAFRRAAGQKHELPAAHQLRIEMIRSELAVRGLRPEEATRLDVQSQVAQAAVQQVEQPTVTVPTYTRPSLTPVLDDLADWKALRRTHIEPEYQQAEAAWKAIRHDAHLHPAHAVETLKRLKEAHADLKLLDRTEQRRRYRVAIFGV